MKLHFLEMKIKNFCYQSRIVSVSRINAMIVESSCLIFHQLYGYFIQRYNFKMAKLAAYWAFREALRLQGPISVKCFRYLIEINNITNSMNLSVEHFALNELVHARNIDEILINDVAHLYKNIMYSRYIHLS